MVRRAGSSMRPTAVMRSPEIATSAANAGLPDAVDHAAAADEHVEHES